VVDTTPHREAVLCGSEQALSAPGARPSLGLLDDCCKRALTGGQTTPRTSHPDPHAVGTTATAVHSAAHRGHALPPSPRSAVTRTARANFFPSQNRRSQCPETRPLDPPRLPATRNVELPLTTRPANHRFTADRIRPHPSSMIHAKSPTPRSPHAQPFPWSCARGISSRRPTSRSPHSIRIWPTPECRAGCLVKGRVRNADEDEHSKATMRGHGDKEDTG
jgi:hypothetical protein